MEVIDIAIQDVNQFSERDKAYYIDTARFKEFIAHDFDIDAFPSIIAAKSKQEIDRPLIVKVLEDQYASVASSSETRANLAALSDEKCFTIVTAHQPSLLTGPLYYIYKILSTIKLTERLKANYSNYRFVPCFILGSEDHDFDEINHVHLYGKSYKWESSEKGSVGSFSTANLDKVLEEVIAVLGQSSKAINILNSLKKELPSFSTYDQFAFRLTHLLFDHLGLIILRMNDSRLKKAFTPIIKAEILKSESKKLVVKSQESIKEKLGYGAQAYVREINFFYCLDQRRDRIELKESRYHIVDSNLSFSAEEMIQEIENHPERFSPNVVMRPIYQEYILPNLAYIGGGGELAYWIERKTQFEHFSIPYPMLIRRNSGMILTPSHQKQLSKLGLNVADSFGKEQDLISRLISDSDHPAYALQDLKPDVEELFEKITERVASIDKTLMNTAGSEKAKVLKSLDFLESKLKKVIKQKEEVNIKRLTKLKSNLFPKGLQERHDNIFQYISTYGVGLIDELYEHCDPFDKTFKVFVMPQSAG